jgi:23S rRNA pseudouridine1911/1915/1917 synthase
MELPILYEDHEIVVIDKPSGVIVNRAETVKEETVQDWMAARYGESWQVYHLDKAKSEDTAYFLDRFGLVHRLDKETSGAMVLAKTPGSFIELLRQFREREVQKEYTALTHGIWKLKQGEIAASVGRMRHNRQMMGVREDGRESVTEYQVIQEYLHWEFAKELRVDDRGYAGFSLVRFLPKTGRTHQIRVHAKHMGHPLVGDPVYAGRKRSREDRKWAKRVMLQAQKLELTHPVTRERMVFESKGEEVNEVLKSLKEANYANLSS